MGQGAIVQTDARTGAVTFNGADNPVPKGGAITLFATGAGLWNYEFTAGQILLGNLIGFETMVPLGAARAHSRWS